MKKLMRKLYYTTGAAFTMSLVSGSAMAQNTVGTISDNIVSSLNTVPGLIAGGGTVIGSALILFGSMNIKDHIEDPQQTELKTGVAKVGIGGGLLAMTYLQDAFIGTITGGDTVAAVDPVALQAVGTGIAS